MKPKVKKRSPRLHVKIFLSLVFVAAFILGALWITTVLLFGRFYRHARMNELKRACLEVSYTVESAKSDRRAVIERLVAEEGINVRIVNITAFENAYVGGDGIVKKGIENTIRGIGRLGRDGMAHTNDVILGIMLEK